MTSGVTPSPKLHHFNLKTTRLQDMIDWYGLVIGTKVNYQWPGGAFLTNDAANHRVALLAPPGVVDDAEKIRHAGLHHTAYEYPSMDGLLATYVRLKGLGVVPQACLDHGMTMSFYYVDPDGNAVELQCDVFGDWAQSNEFMRTSPQFAADPIGTLVDPDRVLAARDAGATAAEVHRRAYSGEFSPDVPPDLLRPRRRRADPTERGTRRRWHGRPNSPVSRTRGWTIVAFSQASTVWVRWKYGRINANWRDRHYGLSADAFLGRWD